MAVYTFSTKEKRPMDTEAVEKLKKHCEANNLNFSAIVVNFIKEWAVNNEPTNRA